MLGIKQARLVGVVALLAAALAPATAGALEPPVANDDAYATPSGTTLIVPADLGVLANDFDADGDGFRAGLDDATTNGSVRLRRNGSFVYRPDPGFSGTDSFTYIARAIDGSSAPATVTITVGDPGNTPPIAGDVTASGDEDITIVWLPDVTDPDGDTLSCTIVSQPSNGTATVANDCSSGEFTGDADFNGSDSFVYGADDGNGGTDTGTVIITVLPVNDAPTGVDDEATTDEDTAVDIDVLANDSDADGDSLIVTNLTNGLNGTTSIDIDGSVIYTPDPDFNGTDAFSYTANDGTLDSNTVTVMVTVNAAANTPPIAGDVAASGDEDITIVWLPDVTDPDGDTLTCTIVVPPSNGTATVASDCSMGDFVGDADFNGTDIVTYGVDDGNGGTDTGTVTITVLPVNDAPVGGDDEATTDEDTTVDIDVLANDSDVDGDSLVVTNLTNGLNGTTAIDIDGSVSYTPDPDFNGTDSFSYTANDGTLDSGFVTVAVTVLPVNDAPVAVDDSATTDENLAVDIDVLSNDSDVDGDTLTITNLTNGSNGTTSLDPSLSFVVYTPDPGFSGTDTFTYVADDGTVGSNVATVAVTVNPAANNPPVANDVSGSGNEDTTIIWLPDVMDPDGDTITCTIVIPPSNGTATVASDCSSGEFVGDADFNGTDTFVYGVDDGNGGTDTGTVTILVVPVNDAPVAGDTTGSGNEDTVITWLPDVADPDAGDTLTCLIISTTPNGVPSVAPDCSVGDYVPNADFNGTDTFVYLADDGNGGSDTGTVTITVLPVNDPPVGVADEASTDEDTAVDIDVLANDSDVDGDPLTVTNLTNGVNGTTAIDIDGSVIYTPDPGFVGIDTFTYTANDGQLDSDTVTVAVTVNLAADSPLSPA